MIVADASVVVAALLGGNGAGATARERLRRDPDLHAPHLLDIEVLSALRRRIRLGQSDRRRAELALADLGALAAIRWSHEPLRKRIWQLRDNLSAYDAVYVALAEALQATLVTVDVRLSRTPRLHCRVELLAD